MITKRKIEVGKYEVDIFLPEHAENCPIVYTHSAEEEIAGVPELLRHPAVLVRIGGICWERDLSPWPAERAFRGGVVFSGGADAYLEDLTERIIPETEAALGFAPSRRMLAGYSLAGLFTIYAMYKTTAFVRGASMSGSLWYDGFLDFMRERTPETVPERFYFSLGDRERITKNSRMAAVEDRTREAERILGGLGAETVFERNAGGHFADIPARMARGIDWITETPHF